MIFVYVIESEQDGSQYVGMSANVEKRLESHNRGQVRSTRLKVPWEIIYIEPCNSRVKARIREKYLKSAAGRRFRKKLGH